MGVDTSIWSMYWLLGMPWSPKFDVSLQGKHFLQRNALEIKSFFFPRLPGSGARELKIDVSLSYAQEFLRDIGYLVPDKGPASRLHVCLQP